MIKPEIAMIVPVTGATPSQRLNLESLMRQKGASCQVIMVVADRSDEALSVSEDLSQRYPHSRVVIAGKAEHCSQKNWNLIAGVQSVEGSVDVLVFCDSGHQAHDSWLSGLIKPITEGAMVSSGYHQVYSEKKGIFVNAQAVCVQFLSQIRKLPGCRQTWGGATAIRADCFDSLKVIELWSTNIVDDVSLSWLLSQHKIGIAIPDQPDLATNLSNQSVTGLQKWLIRQWAYLKYIHPLLWLLTGLVSYLASSLVCGSLLLAGSSVFFFWGSPLLFASGTVLLCFILFVSVLYKKHPEPGNLLHWYFASLIALLLSTTSHLASMIKNEIEWSGISYRVTMRGRVTMIIRPNSDMEITEKS